jgi:membrane protein YqaA with SNARE-associated domain
MSSVKLFLGTLAYSFIAGVFPVLNIEIYLIGASALLAREAVIPLIVAATAGQMAAKSLLYLGGRGLLHIPMRGAREKIESIAERLKNYRRGTWTLMLVSSFIGLPPFYIVSIAAGTLRLNFGLFFLIGALGRLVRFTVVTVLPQFVKQ